MRRWFTTGFLLAVTATLLLVLVSCGGGGSGPSGEDEPSNDWDAMIWDMGFWQ